MPLSEHEQRMLDQIESALYAEDPKFASNVRGGRMRAPSSRRRFQAAALFVVGLILLIAGLQVLKLGSFPILSLVGFLCMFGAGVMLLWGGGRRTGTPTADGAQAGEHQSGPPGAGGSSGGRGHSRGRRSGGGFSSRMEDRFRRRFEQD
ncbi:DUF3040 domain-containing protein [Rhodococcus sp. ACPA4]|uniref:DUF3040 family protein n=2 Tax=Nocardiaceae TaxID=85025 RepID=A0A652YZ26_NOCGL|nr:MULTISPECIES: DUF3040 domain-containing protein [Rhodococcus]NMD58908.1 DUF3040 domain-containing protein [Nocardia globerula]NRI66149.1 DUF3040 domain-containing protein [Rhodococcus sp. MS16]KJF19896.1 hypothetical protein SZ00_05195 [Rhodococcus sp. AD45]MCE4266761.1 DUF3040 domain-containing protein [Rhodococcus globerulus]MDV6267426.1 DUF3040 domain-containing protein [Rhodococcus globerulus]